VAHNHVKAGSTPAAANEASCTAQKENAAQRRAFRYRAAKRPNSAASLLRRDGGCILRNSFDVPSCESFDKNGVLIKQADHLITRANSATFADPRLVVCVCKGHHGWKKWHQKEYEARVAL
jgi:hypothetical protein